jgi:hypothetical protein
VREVTGGVLAAFTPFGNIFVDNSVFHGTMGLKVGYRSLAIKYRIEFMVITIFYERGIP